MILHESEKGCQCHKGCHKGCKRAREGVTLVPRHKTKPILLIVQAIPKHRRGASRHAGQGDGGVCRGRTRNLSTTIRSHSPRSSRFIMVRYVFVPLLLYFALFLVRLPFINKIEEKIYNGVRHLPFFSVSHVPQGSCQHCFRRCGTEGNSV